MKNEHCYTNMILLIVLTGSLLTACAPTQPAIYKTTTWVVEPNLALDALCFIGIMTGDPYYQNYYSWEYQRFEPKLTPETRQALANIFASKQKYGFLISAALTPIFIKLQPKTLEDLAKALQYPEKLFDEESLGNWDVSMWQLFLSHVPDLKVIVAWLQASGFQVDWENNYLPELKEKARKLMAELPEYNVIPLIEKYARKPLAFDSLTIYLAHYVLPFGVGLDSDHSLFYPQISTADLVDYAIHEFFHSVIRNVDEDPKLWEALYFVKDDAFYMQNFKDHDPSFGYNTLEEYIEEDVVEAMDQLIAEEAEVAQDAVTRWRNSSPNLQILTPIVYSLLCSEDFANGAETYPEFLIRMVQEGKLKAGMIESANHKFLGLNQ